VQTAAVGGDHPRPCRVRVRDPRTVGRPVATLRVEPGPPHDHPEIGSVRTHRVHTGMVESETGRRRREREPSRVRRPGDAGRECQLQPRATAAVRSNDGDVLVLALVVHVGHTRDERDQTPVR